MVVRQLPAAAARSAAVRFTCTSFSADANVEGETAGPTDGPTPNAGGAPGVGSCALAAAAPNRPREAWVKNCLRDFDMCAPNRHCSGDALWRTLLRRVFAPLRTRFVVVVETRSQECERGTQECVRHIDTINVGMNRTFNIII